MVCSVNSFVTLNYFLHMFVSRIVPKDESNEVHSHFCHSILDFSLKKSLHKKSVEAKSKRCKLKRGKFLSVIIFNGV